MYATKFLLLGLALVLEFRLGRLGLLDTLLIAFVLSCDQGAAGLKRDIAFEIILISDILSKKLECRCLVICCNCLAGACRILSERGVGVTGRCTGWPLNGGGTLRPCIHDGLCESKNTITART